MRKSSVRVRGYRGAGVVALLAAVGLTVSACSSGTEVVTVTVTPGQAAASVQVTAPDVPSSGASISSSAAGSVPAGSSVTKIPGSEVVISAKPALGSKNVAPDNPVTLAVFAAKLTSVTLTGNDGRRITGSISADKGTWTSTERLRFGTTYTFSGDAQSTQGKQVPITGKISTITPKSTESATIQIPNGDTVGVAAPIIITFAGVVTDRAAAERELSVTTSAGAALKGNWGWLQDGDVLGHGVIQSQVHWRPTVSPVTGTTPYWPANTKVHVQANLNGADYGNGQWGDADISSDFTVGRSQIVYADALSHRLVVTVNNEVTKNYAVSYGADSVPGKATLNGIHIVMEKDPTVSMCNPQFNYCNALEKWAVRINDNGEFIHQNLLAKASFGIANVSAGCINMGDPDAEDFYNSALYGDPVIVSNSGGPQMSEKNFIYDWIYSPAQWQALSAL
jgi:lipoprotein-anchoring transpeptidase ErfK/SrfK